MNRRNKSLAKKIEFAPKIPIETEIPVSQTKESVEIPENKTFVEQNVMKGAFAPKTFISQKSVTLGEKDFIFQLPDFFFESENECKLVVFSDNTYGIKMNGKIYECDGLYIGDTMMVDLDDKARCVGYPDVILTGYPYSHTE